MSLDQLTDKIIEDASERKDSILNEAKSYAEKKEKETVNLSRSIHEKFKKELEEKLLQNIEKVTRHAEREVKTLIDKTKRNELDNVFKETLNQLENSSDDLYKKIIISLFETLPETIKGTLLVKPKRISVIKEILDQKNISLSLKEDPSLKEGFIIQSDSFEYDGTFERLLEEKKNQLEVNIANILFK